MKTGVTFNLDGKKVRKLIANKGMSQTQFAKEAGISRTYVSLIINDRRHVSPQMAKKVADALKVKMDDIFLPVLFTNSETGLSVT